MEHENKNCIHQRSEWVQIHQTCQEYYAMGFLESPHHTIYLDAEMNEYNEKI
jgi:hypothetical protein